MDLLSINRIEKNFINELPPVSFTGEIVLVDSPAEASRVASELSQLELVGFDTESRPSFRRGVNYPVSLLQLSTHTHAYLLQLRRTGFPKELISLLSSHSTKKLGVGIKDDIAKLLELSTFTPGGFVDLSTIAAEKGIIQVGARALTARYLNCRLIKSSQKTNWARTDLTDKQMMYAATDAWICLEIYPKLLADTTDYRQFIEAECEDDEKEDSA